MKFSGLFPARPTIPSGKNVIRKENAGREMQTLKKKIMQRMPSTWCDCLERRLPTGATNFPHWSPPVKSAPQCPMCTRSRYPTRTWNIFECSTDWTASKRSLMRSQFQLPYFFYLFWLQKSVQCTLYILLFTYLGSLAGHCIYLSFVSLLYIWHSCFI